MNLIALKGLLTSKKALLCLLIFVVSAIALFVKRLDGPSFAAIVSTVAIIYNYCQHKIDLAIGGSDGYQ